MNTIRIAAIGIIALSLASAPVTRAACKAFDLDHDTITINGVTCNWPGDYYVAYTNYADVLLIQNGGVLSDWDGYLGYEVSSSNNSVLVTGPNSFWNNHTNLFVGYSGAGNSLVISNGGLVPSGYGYMGGYMGYNSSSSNNSVLVTGPNSLCGALLYVGYSGSGNSLVISNGGLVGGLSYVGYNFSSSNNSVLVTSPGSGWSNGGAAPAYIGVSGSGNSLVISDGGVVDDDYGYVGYNSSSSNNSVLVTGPGSFWNNTMESFVGYYGSGNSLVISNGGSVAGGETCTHVGYNSSSSNNRMLVTGTNSVWSSGDFLSVGESGSGNSLVISDGGQVLSGDGLGVPDEVGYKASSGNNSVLVTGPGSVWNPVGLCVGCSGAGNSLVISNGGRVDDASGLVGYNSSSSNNSVLVTGPSSVWSNVSLYFGCSGASNNLVISNGGYVCIGNCGDMVVGNAPSAFNNVVRVDSGSLIVNDFGSVNSGADNHRSLVIGRAGQGKLILNGGTVAADSLILTNGANSRIEFNGGLLKSRGTAVTNGQQFVVGNGVGAAEFCVLGGIHSFADGLRIRANALLAGWGTNNGSVLVDAGGTVVADSSIEGGIAVNVYSNYSESGGGWPYSGLVGSFCTNAVSFGSFNGIVFEKGWGPFCLGNFGADITGSLNVPSLSSYTFSLNSCCGSLLFIDGSLVVNNGTSGCSGWPQAASGSGTLTAGIHTFEVRFFAEPGNLPHDGLDLILPAGVSYVQRNSGTLTFTGIVTNNGTMRAINGTTFEFYGPVVNNGIIDIIDGTANFHSSFTNINNGTVVDASYFRVVDITRQTDDINITWTTVGGDNYVVQVATGAADGSYSNNFTDLSPTIAIPGSGLGTTSYLDVGGATNTPARYYRIRLSSPTPIDP